MRIKTSGTTRIRQKLNMIHLLMIARRPLMRSKSLGANGLPVAGSSDEETAIMLNFIGFLYSLNDQVGGDVNGPGNNEQDDAENKKNPVMIVTEGCFPHFGRNGGRNRSNRISEGHRDTIVMTGCQQHGHRFTDRAAHAEHAGSEQSVASSGKENAAHCFPGIRAKSQGGLAA